MRKPLIVLVPLLLVAAVVGGGVWLSQREDADATAAGTLVQQPADGLLVGRSTDVRVPWGRLQVTITEPLDSVAGWADGVGVRPGARRQYVAVPDDAEEVTVTMTYDGVTQTVDAATGDVSVGEAAPLYDPPFPAPGGPCGDQLWSTGARALAGAGNTCFVLGSATRPYVAGLGWATEGSRWLVVTVAPGQPTGFETRRGTVEVRPSDVETTYALGFEEPVEVWSANDLLDDSVPPDPLDPQVVVFEVPADRQPGQMDIRTRLEGELQGPGRGRTVRALVAQGAFV